MGCTPGSQRHHTSVVSRRLNLILCTRHQCRYTYHIAGCHHHHEFILLSRQVSSMAEQPFCKRQVVGSTPPPGSTVPVLPGRHGSQRRSSLGYAEGNLSVKSVGGINSLNAFVLAQPPDAKQWQSSGTLPQNYSACTFGQVTAHPCRVQSRFYGSFNTQHPA